MINWTYENSNFAAGVHYTLAPCGVQSEIVCATFIIVRNLLEYHVTITYCDAVQIPVGVAMSMADAKTLCEASIVKAEVSK